MQICPQCREMRQFVECDVADQVSVFFVPVLSGSVRRMVCTTCGEDLELSESRPAAPPAEGTTEPAQPRRASDADLEKQLADLKQRMRS